MNEGFARSEAQFNLITRDCSEKCANQSIAEVKGVSGTFAESGGQFNLIAKDSEKTNARQSIAEGKGLNEAFVGSEAQFNVITKDSEKTNARQSIAEGKGLNEAFVGSEAQFNVITKDSEKNVRYNEGDCVTVLIEDKRGQNGASELSINDNKDGVYTISYSPREQGRCSIIVKVNGEHVYDSPFSLFVKAPKQALGSQNLSTWVKKWRRAFSLPKLSFVLFSFTGAGNLYTVFGIRTNSAQIYSNFWRTRFV